jgi:hypothetical protein
MTLEDKLVSRVKNKKISQFLDLLLRLKSINIRGSNTKDGTQKEFKYKKR